MSTVLRAALSKMGWLQITKNVLFTVMLLHRRLKKKELNMFVFVETFFLCRKKTHRVTKGNCKHVR